MAKRKGSSGPSTIAAAKESKAAAAPRAGAGEGEPKRKAPAPIVSTGYWLLKSGARKNS